MRWTGSSHRAARDSIRPGVEPLEGRPLLSASLGTTNDDNLIHASEVWHNYGVTGQGMTVAVIDTGVNYDHEALGGGFGSGFKVEAGADLADGTTDPMATDSQHGTAVAGLIASSDPDHPGVAPGADIVALRVFASGETGDYNTVADALQWVIDNHATDNITTVNLSLSNGLNYTQNWFATDGAVGQRVTALIAQLDTLNIPVIAAAGNDNPGQEGMGFPAIVPDTISVTASDSQDHILPDAQRLGATTGGVSATDLAAPGQGLIAPIDGTDNFASADGTSFATPLVSGAVVLLQQIYESRFGQLPTVNALDSWLTQGADLATDPSSGFTIPRLDIAKAAALIPVPPTVAAESLPSPSPTPTPQTIHSLPLPIRIPASIKPKKSANPPTRTTRHIPIAKPVTRQVVAPRKAEKNPPASRSAVLPRKKVGVHPLTPATKVSVKPHR